MSDLDPGKDWLEALQWDAQGLMPAIAQDAASGRVLMFAVLVLGVAALRRWWRQRPGPGPGELSAG